MSTQTALFENVGEVVEQIPVHISYEIIHLFSEGLYKSPHKAIEELVTNSYDANAKAGAYSAARSRSKWRQRKSPLMGH